MAAPDGMNTDASPVWQSTQPRRSVPVACMVGVSSEVWQLTHPEDFWSAIAWDCCNSVCLGSAESGSAAFCWLAAADPGTSALLAAWRGANITARTQTNASGSRPWETTRLHDCPLFS